MTLSERVEELCVQHGSLRAAARAIRVDSAYLHRLASGEKARPSKEILKLMGLRSVTTYERIKP